MTKIPTLQALLLAAAFALTGCAATNYGDEQLKLSMASAGKDILWVPHKIAIVHKMLDAAPVPPGHIVYDLGAGDGIIPMEALNKYGARVVGSGSNAGTVVVAQRKAQGAGRALAVGGGSRGAGVGWMFG